MQRLNTVSAYALSLALGLGVTACGDDDSDAADETTTTEGTTTTGDEATEAAGDEAMGDTGSGGAAEATASGGMTPTGCADPGDASARVGIDADIEADTTLTCDTVWVLETTIFVRGSVLTIEAGTTILGAGGSALVILEDSRLEATGTAEAPIVMTSLQAEGDRNRGDWGGLVLVGDAPVNLDGGVGSTEGFAEPFAFGGTDAAHNCGTLQYMRVEWAGFEISAGNELNGITFYACGSDTTVDHIQSHMGADDGIEMFGGSFDAKYVVITGAADDSLDCDQGYQGNIQFMLIHQDPAIGEHAFEWSNQDVNFVAEPATTPVVANVTFAGSGSGGDKSVGVIFKEGTQGGIHSSIMVNITNELMVLTQQETQDNAEAGALTFEGNIVSGGPFSVDKGAAWTPVELEGWALADDNGNLVDVDPMVGSIEWTAPNVQPAADSPAADCGSLPDDTFFEATTYCGAVDPAGDDWTQASWINYAI